MRDSLTALAALFAIALVALMVGPHFVDWDAQRGRLASAIEARTGISTRITGPLRISLLPTPEFDAEEIEFGPPEAPVARAGRLTFSLSPIALLSGRLSFSAARADRVQVVRSALQERLSAKAGDLENGSLAQVGVEQLDVRGLRFVERIEGPAPGGPGALDLALEAPSLLGPFRLQVLDPVPGRDFRAQVGKLEKGRARLKGVIEDKRLGSRVTLDGWFGVPGASGRPVFDGAATFNGNPVLSGKDGTQLPFQGTARLIAHLDQAIADPINLTLGQGEGAFQLAGQGFLDLKGGRPQLQLKLGAKRYDALPHFTADDTARRGREPVSGFPGALGALEAPFDLALDLAVGAVQVPGAVLQDVTFRGALRPGGAVVDLVSAQLPGGTRAAFRRAGTAGALPVDGWLEIDAAELQTLVGWIRGAEGAAHLPASAMLSARLAGGAGGLRIPEIRIDSAAGVLGGSGELLPAEAGRRALPKLTLDLAAERFDARVLAALDPLRPIPGVELATRLAVKRLALDGQELGGLQVVLDRDGATATLRQLRLTGRKGEEVTLSGTASEEALQMTAKLDAERLGDIAQLAGAILPGPVMEGFIRRAGQLEPAIAIANLRLVTKAGDATWDVVVDGKLGGSTVRGRSQSSLKGGDLLVALEAEFTNPDGGRLAGQITGVAAPSSTLPGRLVLKAEGNPRRAVSGTVTGALAGVDLGFDGSLNPFRATPLEGRFTLAAADLAVPGGLLGGHPGLFPRGVPGRVAGRLLADRGKVLLTGLDAASGEDPLSGEVSFDLTRGGQIAGQIRMGAISLQPLLAPVLGTGGPETQAGWSAAGFAPAMAPPLAGDLWIEARKAVLPGGVTLETPQFVLRFAPGAISFENVEAKAGEARIAGGLSLLRKDARVEVAGRLDFARVPLMALGARASGEIPFTAGGESPQELVGSLSGAGKIAFDELAVGGADPQALARVVALPLDDLAPINENRIGGLVEQELRKGDLRLAGVSAPLGLINGQLRIAAPPQTIERAGASVTPVLLVDLLRREAEARFSIALSTLPKDWSGALPEISLALTASLGGSGSREPGLRRRLQVASLVNGFLAMAIQRDLERAEAFEADVREREAQLRRQRGDAFMERRAREILDVEVAIEREAQTLRRRAERDKADREKAEREKAEREAAELTAKIRALEAPQPPAAVAPPLDLTPKLPVVPAPVQVPAPPG